MRKFYYLCILSCMFFSNSFSQSVLNPDDPVITYNAAKPPSQPAFGNIGKWVRTKYLTWNTEEYKCYIYKGRPFRLHFPKTYNPSSNDGKKYPVLIFFHGLGEADTSIYDNEYQLYHSGDVFQDAVDNGTFDGYIFAMQSDGFWGNNELQDIKEILDYMIANNKADPFAISVNGLSAGGQAAWEMLFNYPAYTAACIPMSSISASYNDQSIINEIKFSPVWYVQGGRDGSPSPYTAHLVRDAMLNAGADLTYTEFSTQGHDTWDSTWLMPDFFPYLLRAYSSNPWTLYGKTKFCPGDTIDITIGLAPGFDDYEWRYNGTLISSATSNTIHVTQTGTYTARVKRNGLWSEWSKIPVKIIVQSAAKTPAIKVAGLMSRALPGADRKNFVNLTVSGNNTYVKYTWKKVGSDSVYSTQPVFTATAPGYYIVNALPQDACSSLYSPAFKVIDANGGSAPNAVKGFIANTLSNTKILLAWSPFVQQANPPFAVEIYRGTASGTYAFVGQVRAAVTSFRDSALAPKTKYYYIVRAIDSTGASALSPEVSSLTYSDTTAPTIPSNLQITYTTPSTISISWKPSTDNVAVDHYNIYVNNNLRNVTKQTTFVLSSLTKNQSYAIYVKAADASDNISSASNQVTSETILGGLKYSHYKTAVPLDFLPDVSSLQPNLTGVSKNVDVNVVKSNILNIFLWQGYINIPVSGTYTFRTTSDDGSALWFNSYTPVGTRLVDNDGKHVTMRSKAGTIKITKGVYPICIEYFHNDGVGDISVSWSCKELFGDTIKRPIADSFFNGNYINTGNVPALPGKLTATAKSYNKISITWQDNSSNETGFEIYRALSIAGVYKIIATVSANKTSFTDTTLSALKQYYYSVQAINQYGNSGQSSIDSATTFALSSKPGSPSGFKATAVSSSKIELSWKSGVNATSYELLRSNGDSLNYRLLRNLPASAVSYADTDLNASFVYYYEIKAIGISGTASKESMAYATTKNNAPVISKLKTIKVPYSTITTISLTATDTDGDLLTFKAKKLPSFASVHNDGSDSASLIIDPSQANIGTYDNLKIIVTDPYGGIDSTVFKLIINNNLAPTLHTIPDYTLNEGNSVSIALIASDANGDTLNWSVTNAPKSFNLINKSNGQATLILQPNYLAAGSYVTSVTVDDGKGGTATRQFNVTVKDFNPNTNVYARFQYSDTIGKPWNNITSLNTYNLVDASGKPTTIDLKLKTSWFATYNAGPTTGDNSGIYPDAVLKDYYYFGIFGGPQTVDTRIAGLDTSKLYNLTFFSASNYGGIANGSTIFTAGNKSDSLKVQENTKRTKTISDIKPASNGSILYTLSKSSDADAGYLNALLISSLYDDGIKPANPTSLTAQNIPGTKVQLSWTDVSYNEEGYKIYRSPAATKMFTVVGKTSSEATSFIDATVIGNKEYLYKVQAYNAHGNSNFSNTISITTFNRIPEINAISDVILNNNKSVTIKIKAKDDSTDHLILSSKNLPSFATLNDNGDGTGNITVTPAINSLGLFNVTVIATDKSGASDSASFNILVKDPKISSTYLSFSDGQNALPAPWNLIGPYPVAGKTFSNLKDDDSNSTGMTLTFKNSFEGIVESGMQPAEGVGIYPNVVMRTAAFEGTANSDTIQLSGLSLSKAYNFVFFNSHDDGLDGTTNFTIGNKTIKLNATDNITKTVQLNGIVPDARGIVNIIVFKATGADYAYVTSLIIQSYDTTYTNIAPANLRIKNVTRNSITLLWQDRASSETRYQIWRAKDGAKNYTLLTTVSANIKTYTDSNLTVNKTYSYAVRAVFGNEYSDFSNTVSASTYAYRVYVNFTATNKAVLPWNNLNAVPQNGYTWSNFFDETGMITGTGMELNTEWAGMYSEGMNAAGDSGIFPNNVMIDSYGLFPGQVATFKVTGLNIHMKYDFTFYASSQAWGDVNVAYTINGVTTILNASLNVNGTETIYGVTSDDYGNVTIEVAPGTPGSQYGLLGALIIGAYTPSLSGVVPALPASAFEFVNSTKQEEAITVTNKNGNDVIAFPNPFHNYVVLSLPSKISLGKLQVTMYDVRGIPVYKNEFANAEEGNTIKIMTSNNLAPGVYTIRVINDNSKETKSIKLIKR